MLPAPGARPEPQWEPASLAAWLATAPVVAPETLAAAEIPGASAPQSPLFVPEMPAVPTVPPVILAPPVPPTPPVPPRPRVPAPAPAEPDWWERASAMLLENWTGILGAVVLVTGVGFLGIYAALRVAPPFRFLLICTFAAALLGGRFALRNQAFAQKLNAWLLSSAAAIFLFACVGAVSIEGLRWATPPFDYLLLLAGVSVNLALAWRASREEVATLHGVLSLVALAVLPPTVLTLVAAAGVTTFGIAITWRQRWKYQLLLSIASFFAFHLHWHQQLATISNVLRLEAMALVLLVGGAAAVVQYRSVYAQRRFEPLLFAAHLLNWTCLGLNLYLYSTGSIWKTIPLALGALLTFWAGRKARQLGIGWLFQTDTIISLILALATALSLQGWHATTPVILLFMLLEALLVALIMAREGEALVYRVALSGAALAGAGLVLVAAGHLAGSPPATLYRDALVLALGGWAGLAFVRLIFQQPLLQAPAAGAAEPAAIAAMASHRRLLGGLAGVAGLLQLVAGLLLARVLFAWAAMPTVLLLGALLGLAAAALALAAWLRTEARVPEWIRQQQLVLAQGQVVLAGLGLHELHLSWPLVLGLVYAENLAVALLALRRRELLLYRVALSGAGGAGLGVLLAAAAQANLTPATLYRNALVLALAGAAGRICAQHLWQQLRQQLRQQLLPRPAATSLPAQNFSETDQNLLGGLAGLCGLLLATAGLLIARVLFDGHSAPAGALAALLALAGGVLALGAWVHAGGLLPRWVRRQQLVLFQLLLIVAVLGLHELRLAWPAVFVILYAEYLLAALLLNGRDEDSLLRTQVYLTVLLAGVLPVLVRLALPEVVGPVARAGLLTGAALLTLGYQLRRYFLARPAPEFGVLQLGAALRIPALGLAVGWLLLQSGALVHERAWGAWAMVALLGGLLYLRRRVALPGLWAGLVLAAAGYLALQWYYVLATPAGSALGTSAVLRYLLPTVAVPVMGLLASWWPAENRFVRWPWVYLLALHLLVALLAAVPAGHVAYFVLGLLTLGGAAFAGAQRWRRALPDEAAVQRAGTPDRFLLHVAYWLLAGSLLTHLWLLGRAETFVHQPAEYFTAALLFGVLAAVAGARPPATAPTYRSWQWLHPWLPEATLLFGTLTLAHNLRTPWLPLVWVAAAFALTYAAAALPARFRRLGLYGRLYYGLAAGTASVASLAYLSPGQLLSPAWLEIAAAVALLFGYVGLALRVGNAPFAGLAPGWQWLARPTRRTLEAGLLYPAFLALSLLFIQSFDRSVLTVLLMLEVVAIFSTSLLLRRQDLRYLSLAGMLGCLVRLVFFDLSRSGTITRAVVFIFMGLLLLGMNALYARFKARFAPDEAAETDAADETDESISPDESIG